ncbi:MAG: protein kinase [Acidimicrobiia bacterium]|nr:protein kinase [Acidimicrobiia bacterium]
MTEQTSSLRTTNDRYRLRRELAVGGMATVYLADDLVLDRPVALKVLLPKLASDPAFVDRFRREAQSSGRLRHPNIVAVYDWGSYGDSYCIAMEYVEGRTLDDIIAADGPLPPAEAARIAVEVAEALDAAHQQGLVHRDVKPGNIMITPSGKVKITDFGIARAARNDRDLTEVGMIVGTASYLSPEQARGAGVDPRSDLYALGVVLFEMVTGQRPFVGDSALAVAGHHVSTPPPRLRSIRPSLPPAIDELVDRLLAKNPDDRYQSASGLVVDLRKIAGASESDDQRTAVMVPDGIDGVDGRSSNRPAPPATEIMPDSIRPDRRPRVEDRRPPVDASRRAIDTPPTPVPARPSSGATGRASGRSGLLVIGALVAVGLFAGVLALAAWMASQPSGVPDDTTTTTAATDQTTISPPAAEPVELPDFTGQSQSAAEQAVADLGLVARVEQVDVDDPSQAGQVVGQDPSPSVAVEPGSTVIIRVGRSAATTTVATSTTTTAPTTAPPSTDESTSPSTSG